MELTDEQIADRWWERLKSDTTYIKGHRGLRRAWNLAKKHGYDPSKMYGDDVYQLWLKQQEL
jgi:hypothetical protein